MEPVSTTRAVFSFGPFHIDARDRALRQDGVEVSLTLKAAETLLVLVENAGHAVEKDALLSRAWPDTFVEESTLAQNILTQRRTLGKQPNGEEYIGTVPKRGHRFDASVSINGEALNPALPGAARQETSASPSMSHTLRFGLVILAGLGIIAFVALWFRGRPTPRVAETRARLVVLPFANLSEDPKQEYLSEGLTEELITQIGSLDPEQLAVIARTSAMVYRNTTKSADEIGRELNVDFLLEGSVRRDQDRIRVSTRPIRASDQSSLWTADYDRELRDTLTLESDVSRSIATQIALHLSAEQASRLQATRPVDPQANKLYLKGRHFWNRRTPDTINKAIELL